MLLSKISNCDSNNFYQKRSSGFQQDKMTILKTRNNLLRHEINTSVVIKERELGQIWERKGVLYFNGECHQSNMHSFLTWSRLIWSSLLMKLSIREQIDMSVLLQQLLSKCIAHELGIIILFHFLI